MSSFESMSFRLVLKGNLAETQHSRGSDSDVETNPMGNLKY